MSKLGPEPRRY
jgi:hypothetical protein